MLYDFVYITPSLLLLLGPKQVAGEEHSMLHTRRRTGAGLGAGVRGVLHGGL